MYIHIGIRQKMEFYTFTFCIKYTKLLILPSKLLSKTTIYIKKYIQEMITFTEEEEQWRNRHVVSISPFRSSKGELQNHRILGVGRDPRGP